MDKHELILNVQILENLGWFIAEAPPDNDVDGMFDVLLQCCTPDGRPIEEVPVSEFLLSVYEEEDGSLEARLWFFAPKYATSLDNLGTILTVESSGLCLEYSVRRELYNDLWIYEAEITRLGFDDEGLEHYEVSTHYGTSDVSLSMALSDAYLRCVGVYDG